MFAENEIGFLAENSEIFSSLPVHNYNCRISSQVFTQCDWKTSDWGSSGKCDLLFYNVTIVKNVNGMLDFKIWGCVMSL